MCAQAITLSHSTDSLSEMMAGLAVLDNVIDLDHDLEEEEEEEEEEDPCDHYYELKRILTDCVQQTDLSLAWDVMSCHGDYLSKFLRLHHALLHSDSCPLPGHLRHLIAVLASARLSCSYLVQQHRQQLLQLGGKRDWVEKGLPALPEKIKKLYQLNMILAHRPWQMTRDHVAELTSPGPDSWSLSELVHSIILMCHFHSLASFIQSCVMMDASVEMVSGLPGSSPGLESYKVEELMKKMRRLQDRAESLPPASELQERFNSVRVSGCDINCDHHHDRLTEPDISNLVQDVNFQYVDFARREEEYNTFRIQDFSWDEEGYSAIARFDEDIAQLLDEKFRTIYNLTYRTMGSHSSIDTSLFRRASWNYIQCVWGIRHDDYDYHEVNELLHR